MHNIQHLDQLSPLVILMIFTSNQPIKKPNWVGPTGSKDPKLAQITLNDYQNNCFGKRLIRNIVFVDPKYPIRCCYILYVRKNKQYNFKEKINQLTKSLVNLSESRNDSTTEF